MATTILPGAIKLVSSLRNSKSMYNSSYASQTPSIATTPSKIAVSHNSSITTTQENVTIDHNSESETQNLLNKDDIINSVLTSLGKSVNDTSSEGKALKASLALKYGNIISFAQNNGTQIDTDFVNNLKTRLENYAKGREFQNFGLQAALGDDVTFENDCAKAKTLPDLKACYNQFAKEYIETLDKDGNGKIGLYEMFYENLVTNYLQEGLTPTEATQKAIETTNLYLQNKYDVTNLPKADDDIAKTFMLVVNKFVNIETTVNTKIDSELDVNEIAPYLHAIANIEQGNNISGKEYRTMQYAEFQNDGNFETLIQNSKEFLDGIN